MSAGPVSLDLLARAQRSIPGGVNSPVRAYRAVGGSPPFVASGAGAWIVDADGRRYLDLVGSWGALLLGHAHPAVVQAATQALVLGSSFGAPTEREIALAEVLIARVPGVEKVRLCSSGSEATAHAIRLARGATGRDVVVKMDGCYHGAHDAVLVGAGSGGLTFGVPDSAGVPAAVAALTRVVPYNDLGALAALMDAEGSGVAAVILEPVVGNMGCVAPSPGYLDGVAALCHRHGALLILDEVMSGFRVGPQGAAGRYGVTGDLTTLGKIVGGGFPLAAFGGKAAIMDHLAPLGPVYQAGTLSGNPVAVAAGLATLGALDATAYARVEAIGQAIEDGLASTLIRAGACMRRVGGMWTIWFRPVPPSNLVEAKQADTKRFARFHAACLDASLWLPPSQFEAAFHPAILTDAEVDHLVGGLRGALEQATSSG